MVMLVPRSPPTNAPITNMYCSDVDNEGFIQYYTPRDSNGRTAKPLFMIIFQPLFVPCIVVREFSRGSCRDFDDIWHRAQNCASSMQMTNSTLIPIIDSHNCLRSIGVR